MKQRRRTTQEEAQEFHDALVALWNAVATDILEPLAVRLARLVRWLSR